jgi:PAS domain S-box-containing protein
MAVSRKRSAELELEHLVRERTRELVQINEALRRSEERYHTLFESAPDAIVVHRDGRFLDANDEALRLVGAGSFEDLAGHVVLDFFRPQDREDAVERMRLATIESKLPARESTLLRLDGREVVVEFHTARTEFQGAPAAQTIIRDITERKRTEERLRKSEEKHRHLFETVIDGVFIADGQGRFLEVNKSACRQLGYSRDELLRLSVLDISPNTESSFRVLQEKINTEHLLRYETSHRRKDGVIVPIELVVTGIQHEGQRAFLGVARDITERKQAEETLRKREESFRALAENSPDIIERFDREIRHIYVNPLAAKLHGISAEALIGKTNQEIGVPEHYCTFWKERIQQVFQTGHALEEENEFPTTSGKRIYQSRLVPEKAKEGAVTSVLVVSRDVTDRKRAEKMLQEYQKAVESSQDMIAVVDRNYRYLIANRAFLKYRGVGRERIIGRSVSEVLGKDTFEELIKKNLDTCLQGEVVQYEMKWTYPELGERDLSVSYFPIGSPEGINRVASVIRDITEVKRIEEALRESETRRRLNAQVLIAQENERKFIAREIHDGFGSQLATIKYKVEDFLRQIDKNVIGRAGESLKSIIPILQDGIQEARRIQMNLRPSILDDLGVLPTMEWFFRTFAETYPKIKVEKEISVQENDVSPSLKTVIYRTLQEAMDNIAKHSKADLAHLSLRKNEGRVELLVQDNGRGFDLKEVVGSEGSMQGFGLVRMRERTELCGGSFSIDSTEGAGTTIRASWPLNIAG